MDAAAMMEAGWPAQMTLHAWAIERARSLATLERGWDLARGRTPIGGPVLQIAIEQAVEIIAWCAARGVEAPFPYPTPNLDLTSGIGLDWEPLGVEALWLADGVWEVMGPDFDWLAASCDEVRGALERVTP